MTTDSRNRAYKTEEGCECSICLTTRRYRGTNRCVECQRRRKVAYAERQRKESIIHIQIAKNAAELEAMADYSKETYQITYG